MPVTVGFIDGTKSLNKDATLKWLESGGINLLRDYPDHLLSNLDKFLGQYEKNYGFLQQRDFMKDLITFCQRPRSIGVTPLISLNGIYCPGMDDEMRDTIKSFLYYFPGMYQRPFEGGKKELRSLDPKSKLYVICHGHSEMPLFKTKAGTWTANDLANLMESDGLSKDHRELELLVCHAGESVTSISASKKRLALREKAQQANTKGDKAELEKLKKQYGKIKGPKPAEYTDVKQLLPMCAQLVDSLKIKKYNYIRVIGYACTVAMYWAEGEVTLDRRLLGGQWGEKASDHPKLKRIWL